MTTMNEERAGECEAFKAWCESIGYREALMTCGELEAFKAGAAWQRAQGAVPECAALIVQARKAKGGA